MNRPLITNVERDPRALKPFPGNPRKHPAKQIAQLARTMERFGQTNPVLIDEHDTILAGHARVQAAVKLGLKTYPCRRIEGLTSAEKKTILINDNKNDNKIGLNSTWDVDLLVENIVEVRVEDCSLVELTGFEPVEIEAMEVSLVPQDKNGDPADDVLSPPGAGGRQGARSGRGLLPDARRRA